MDAERPPPDYKDPVRETDQKLERTYELIERGVQVEGLQAALPKMWQARRDKIRERDEGVRRACEWFWGIWGKVELTALAF